MSVISSPHPAAALSPARDAENGALRRMRIESALGAALFFGLAAALVLQRALGLS